MWYLNLWQPSCNTRFKWKRKSSWVNRLTLELLTSWLINWNQSSPLFMIIFWLIFCYLQPKDSQTRNFRTFSWVLVAHTCNPSCSGGRDQENCSSKPARTNSSWDPILKKKKSQKRAGGVAWGIGPEFKPQHYTHTHTQRNFRTFFYFKVS
jgi:hypothetical protein